MGELGVVPLSVFFGAKCGDHRVAENMLKSL